MRSGVGLGPVPGLCLLAKRRERRFTEAEQSIAKNGGVARSYNIVLRVHLEHSESWQFEDRQMGAGELARAHKASCFQKVVSNNEKNGGESSNAPVMTLGRRTLFPDE